jgi:16S rRNA processing protein RimM
MTIEHAWLHDQRAVLKFVGVDSIDAAESLRNGLVCILSSEREPLAPGEVYFSDLIGCQAFDATTGELLGIVSDWYETGATPLIVVLTPDDKELLVPFARTIFEQIDVRGRRLQLRLPDGLRELNE